MIEARRPEIIVTDKTEQKGIITDIGVSADVREGEKEREKGGKVPGLEERDWKIEETQNGRSHACSDRGPWNFHRELDRWIEKVVITYYVGVMQKTAMLGLQGY